MSWERNKNFIISQVEAGTADQGMQDWYARWKYSGSPETKSGMLTITEYENKKRYDERRAQRQAEHEAAQEAQAQLDLDRPDGVSRSLWQQVKEGNLNYNLTSIVNQPAVRDAIIEAGYGDYVKAVYEKAMDDRAAHYMSNGADPQDAWNTAQYDWYTQTHGGYNNSTVSDSSANDLGFGGGSTVSNEGYVNTAEQAAAEQAAAEQAAAEQAAAEQAAAEAAAAEQAAAEQAAAEAAAAEQARRQRIAAANAEAVDMSQSNYTQRNTGGGSMLSGYNARRGQQANRAAPSAPAARKPTPFADAYLRAKRAAEAPGPVSGMMKKWLE